MVPEMTFLRGARQWKAFTAAAAVEPLNNASIAA